VIDMAADWVAVYPLPGGDAAGAAVQFSMLVKTPRRRRAWR
jgi:hypothetical protein